MRFLSRSTLGFKLANDLRNSKGTDAVVVCLKESSLLTAITVAAQLRAWVYPLAYAPIYASDGSRRILGAFTAAGGVVSLESDGAIRDEKALHLAEHAVSEQVQRIGNLANKDVLNGRSVLFVGDVVVDILPLSVAQDLLTTVQAAKVTVALGNVTAPVAEQARMIADTVVLKDILSSVVQDDDKYFEQADDYSLQQQYELVHNIATYWQ